MRYFFFSYYFKTKDKFSGNGNLTLKIIGFPNYKTVEREISKKYPNVDSICILNIFEFKNKKDFKDFSND